MDYNTLRRRAVSVILGVITIAMPLSSCRSDDFAPNEILSSSQRSINAYFYDKLSEISAKISENDAKISETSAKISETSAKLSELLEKSDRLSDDIKEIKVGLVCGLGFLLYLRYEFNADMALIRAERKQDMAVLRAEAKKDKKAADNRRNFMFSGTSVISIGIPLFMSLFLNKT